MKAQRMLSVFIAMTALYACSIKPITFRDPVSSNDPFFRQCVQQAKDRHKLDSAAVMSDTMEVFRVMYRQQQVEEDGVLQWQMISENDPRFNAADASVSSGQDIFLYRLHAPDEKEDVFVYFSKAVNGDNNQCTGVGHAYLGRLSTFNNAPTIFFYEEMNFVYQQKSGSYLEPEKKSKKRDLAKMEYIMRFTLSANAPRNDSVLQIDKITITRMNKTGGENPVVYPINSILGNKALRMTTPKK